MAIATSPGFCKIATLDEIAEHGHVLTPGRYVGAEEVEDDGVPFAEKMEGLTRLSGHEQIRVANILSLNDRMKARPSNVHNGFLAS